MTEYMLGVRNNGHSRLVILVFNWAIKIPRLTSWEGLLRGLMGNLRERRWINWPHLCPIVFSVPGGWLTVMQRARELTEEEWESDEWKKVLKDVEIDCCKIYSGDLVIVPRIEDKRDTFGVLPSGEIVVVDWGGFLE